MEKVKARHRVSASTIAIIVLTILLIASIAVGVTLAYFTSNAAVAGNVTLGDPVNINITQGGSAVTSLTFSNDALPGHVYDQVIGVSVPANTSDALLRAKLTISNNDGATINIEATTVDTWVKGSDEYYYYTNIQAAVYGRIGEIARKHKDKITGLTFWGVGDEETWLSKYSDYRMGRIDYPLLFDSLTRERKLSYEMFTDF